MTEALEPVRNRIIKNELVDIERLTPFQGTLKVLDDARFNKLRKSLIEEGFSFTVHVWENADMIYIIDGHQRVSVLTQMRKQGYEVPPINCAFISAKTYRDAKKLVLLAVSQYGKIEKKGFAEFVQGEDFDFDDFDFPDLTFDLSDLSFDDQPEPEKEYNEAIEDEVPEAAPSRVKRGDIWQLGCHKLMCEDSTNIENLNRLLGGHKFDFVFTDPPYGVNFKSNMSDRFEVIMNDDVFLNVAPVIESIMKNDTAAIVWTSQQVYPTWRIQFEKMYKSTVIWAKGGGGMGDLEGDFAPNYEMGLFCVNGRPKFKEGRPGAVWTIGKDASSNYVHPTQKPVALAAFGIGIFTNAGELVGDLFLGSGSTLIACEKTDRICFGMELDPGYCDIIIERWENITGEKAVLLTEG